MDPQQRLVMDSFSEALAAHVDCGHAAGRPTGVYVGVSQLEYARIRCDGGERVGHLHCADHKHEESIQSGCAAGNI